MASNPYDAADLIQMLESNNDDSVQEIKGLIHETLSQTPKETWLLYGLVDYYVQTNSNRCLDILTSIQEPHDKHFFDKITDSLKSSAIRMQALTLLGYVVRKQPSWLHKIANHPLMGIFLKILKTEMDIPTLMNALLVLVTLLPIIPSLISSHITNIFEIFSRLAAWNTNKPAGNVPDIHILHLQVGVYALFHRLYGMYPCNFLSYLRSHYGNREHLLVFSETVRPMLERVRMHPLLVTASKEAEMSATRWKKMETHDIIMECAKVSLDVIEGTREEIPSQQLYLSPTFHCPQIAAQSTFAKPNLTLCTSESQDKAEPLSGIWKLNPTSALAQLMQECSTTWSPSQKLYVLPTPPPLQISGDNRFEGPAISSPRVLTTQLPAESFEAFSFPALQVNPVKTIGEAQPGEHVVKMVREPLPRDLVITAVGTKSSKIEESYSKLEDDEKMDAAVDQEVSDIVSGIPNSNGQSNSVAYVKNELGEQQPNDKGYRRSDSVIHDDAEGIQTAELEESAETSMGRVMDFVCSRIRFHSQCGPAPDLNEILNLDNNLIRAKSCPEITEASKMSEASSDESTDGLNLPLFGNNENVAGKNKECATVTTIAATPATSSLSVAGSSQSVYPNEHLLSMALPILSVSFCPHCSHCRERKLPFFSLSAPEILDRHILLGSNIYSKELKTFLGDASKNVSSSQVGASDEIEILRGQVALLHNQLLFERYKREVHAERNRRLLGKAKKARALEEQNIAMKDQLQLQERYILDFKKEHSHLVKQQFQLRGEKEQEWQKFTSQIQKMQQENEQVKYEKQQLLEQLSTQLLELREQENIISECKAELLQASMELQGMKNKVATNIELRAEVDRLNKELILSGELQQKYREKFSSLSSPSNLRIEMEQRTAAYNNDLLAQKAALDARLQQLDANKERVAELENQVLQKDQSINEQKNMIKNIKEQYEEQIQAKTDQNQGLQAQSLNLVSEVLYLQNKAQLTKNSEDNNQLPVQEMSTEEGATDLSTSNEPSVEESSHAEGYLEKLSRSASAESTIPSDMDPETSNYIKKHIGISHPARRGSTIGGASYSTFASSELRERDTKQPDEESQEMDKVKWPQ